MGVVIDTADFSTGKFKIPQSIHTDLDSYITRYEASYLADLLGASLKTLFVANLTAQVPTSAIYLSLFNAFQTDDGTCIRKSFGIKDMLCGFIWFEYMRDVHLKGSIVGQVKSVNENSEVVGAENYIYQFYNESIQTYSAIQWYIDENSSDYPTYNGICKQINHWSN